MHCGEGFGRTGTILSFLQLKHELENNEVDENNTELSYLGQYADENESKKCTKSTKQAVEYVRENYSQHAVEKQCHLEILDHYINNYHNQFERLKNAKHDLENNEVNVSEKKEVIEDSSKVNTDKTNKTSFSIQDDQLVLTFKDNSTANEFVKRFLRAEVDFKMVDTDVKIGDSEYKGRGCYIAKNGGIVVNVGNGKLAKELCAFLDVEGVTYPEGDQKAFYISPNIIEGYDDYVRKVNVSEKIESSHIKKEKDNENHSSSSEKGSSHMEKEESVIEGDNYSVSSQKESAPIEEENENHSSSSEKKSSHMEKEGVIGGKNLYTSSKKQTIT